MARGSDQATAAATSAQNLSNNYAGNASQLFSTLSPMLESEAAHPSGMAPTDLAAADTAAQETAGGTQAAAVGQGALRAARTRNAGGSDAAVGSAARSAGQELSRASVGTRLKNAALKNEQSQFATKGLGSLFGENLTGGNQALGEVASNVNANTNAENASWDWSKDLLAPILASGAGTKQFQI